MAAVNWILATDVDGTLLTAEYELLPEVRKAIRDARSQGAFVALVSARSATALARVADQVGIVDALVCFGGALTLVRSRNGDLIELPDSARHLRQADAIEVARLCGEAGIDIAFYTRNGVHARSVAGLLGKEFRSTGEQVAPGEIAHDTDPVFKALAISDPGRLDALGELRATLSHSMTCLFSHANYLEIGPPGVTKGTALARLAAGFPSERIVAVGDSENDLSMFATAGLSFAMGNAQQSIKEAADQVTGHVDNAGLARAIEQCLDRFGRTSRVNNAADLNISPELGTMA